MKRKIGLWRAAIVPLIAMALAANSVAAQSPSKITRIGILMSQSETGARDFLDGFREALLTLGLTDGKNVLLEIRYANGRVDRLDTIAAEIVNSGPDILFVGGDQATSALQRATHVIPIVAVTCDALAAGLITNLAKPGGNLTGVTCIDSDLAAKRVEILQEIIPQLSKLGVILNQADHRMTAEFVEAQLAAKARAIAVQPLNLAKLEDIESAFADAVEKGVNGIDVIFDSLTFFYRARVAQVAIDKRLPTIFNFRQYVDSGGLISYGPSLRAMYAQAARHIQKIANGEAPGDIPMEQPTRFELVINLTTAKALGLTMPEELLTTADEVIE
jgi:putative tryptophan/tyrosine transport system substrate-binding protein